MPPMLKLPPMQKPPLLQVFTSVESIKEITAYNAGLAEDMIAMHNACVRETLSASDGGRVVQWGLGHECHAQHLCQGSTLGQQRQENCR